MNRRHSHIDHDDGGSPFSRVVLIGSVTGQPVGWIPAPQGAHTFIDTVHVEVRQPISGAHIQELRGRCRSVQQMRPSRPNCLKWRRVLHIQNPSREALAWLQEHLRQKGLITRVDVALDLDFLSGYVSTGLIEGFELRDKLGNPFEPRFDPRRLPQS